jgi:hypothetical protein
VQGVRPRPAIRADAWPLWTPESTSLRLSQASLWQAETLSRASNLRRVVNSVPARGAGVPTLLSVGPRHRVRGPQMAPPADAAADCTRSWKAFPAVNVGTALAGIGIVSPVRGFRPARAARWRS